MKLLTWDPTKGKKVLCGELIVDTLFRDVNPAHFMRVLQGYGIQEVAFEEIVSKDVKKIVLKETGTSKRWESLVRDWKAHGRVADYGHGKQRFLSTKYMTNGKIKFVDVIEKEVKPEVEQQVLI